MRCFFGRHDWLGCKCRRCGKEKHDWHTLSRRAIDISYSPGVAIFDGWHLTDEEYSATLHRAREKAKKTPPWHFDVIFQAQRVCNSCGERTTKTETDSIYVEAWEASSFAEAKHVARQKAFYSGY